MNKLWCLIIMLLTCRISEGQNLVPNSSFEVYDTCPSFFAQVRFSVPWFQPTLGTSDYFNTCSSLFSVPDNFTGSQNANAGQAYTGFFAAFIDPVADSTDPIYREYIEVKLDSVLQVGQKYFVSFFVSLSDSSNYATDDIQAYFSNDTVKSDTAFILPLTPQVQNTSGSFITNKLLWTKISGQYIAQGGEQFITVGNFKNNIFTDTLYVGGGAFNSGTLPASAYYYIDDVSVSTDSLLAYEEIQIQELSLFPNPFNDKLNITAKRNERVEVTLFDVVSRKIFNQSFTNSISINTQQLAKGIYIYEVGNKNGVIKKGKVVKD